MPDLATLKDKLLAGETGLATLHGSGAAEEQARRCLGLLETFMERFGPATEAGLFSAPGRTEICGNHTDHQRGCVLAGSITPDVMAIAAPNGRREARIVSDGYPDATVDLDRLQPDPTEAGAFTALVRGVAAQFQRAGHAVPGFDIVMSSRVLKGSGLSSSAAFEVLIGTVLNSLFCGDAFSYVDIARMGQIAENEFFQKPCGLMDQLASAAGGIVFIDFENAASPRITRIAANFSAHGHALCIIDSGADHADMTDAYAAIPREMAAVAAMFGHDVLRPVVKTDFLRRLPEVRRVAGDRATLRALHFFNENARVPEEAKALAENRFDDFLALVRESGRSSCEYLQNVYPEQTPRHQAVGLALAMCDELLGKRGAYRVHGGGFAGTVQAFVPEAMLDAFRTKMEDVFGEGHCHVLAIRDVGGVRLA